MARDQLPSRCGYRRSVAVLPSSSYCGSASTFSRTFSHSVERTQRAVALSVCAPVGEKPYVRNWTDAGRLIEPPPPSVSIDVISLRKKEGGAHVRNCQQILNLNIL